MRLGVAIEETWDFFHEVFADLAEHHQTSLFKRRAINLPVLNGRVGHYCLRQDLKTFMRSNKVIFFEWASELLAAATHLPKTCGIVTRLHRYELYKWANQVNWQAVDRLILVSQAKSREFTACFPEQAHKILVIPEAVSVTRFQPHIKTFNGDIGILCHLKPRKRVYELVLMFYELVQERPDFHLHIGGGRAPGFGEYYEAVKHLVERLSLQDKVTFYGHISEPPSWYRFIDIYVSNGYSEGLQVAPMEAMASGCYCLSHHWDGADELLPETNLYYTNAQLKELILRYAETSETAREHEKARMRAIVCDKFNVDKTKLQIRRLVEEAATSLRA
jgi:glycosyltransferase involved in cell wall biosynthesis